MILVGYWGDHWPLFECFKDELLAMLAQRQLFRLENASLIHDAHLSIFNSVTILFICIIVILLLVYGSLGQLLLLILNINLVAIRVLIEARACLRFELFYRDRLTQVTVLDLMLLLLERADSGSVLLLTLRCIGDYLETSGDKVLPILILHFIEVFIRMI